jgi:membrane fusion protein (multidrug efflux system)
VYLYPRSGSLPLLALLLFLAVPLDSLSGQGRPPVAVRTTTVEAAPSEEILTLNGTIRSNESAVVRAEIAGTVEAIPFEEGTTVEKGAVLARIEDDLLRAERAEIEAEIALAESQLQRQQTLTAREATTREALDEARRNLQRYRARLQQVEVELARTVLRAPFHGRLGLREISLGDYLQPGDTVATLEQLDPLKVDFGLPEIHQSQLAVGQILRVSAAGVADVLAGEVIAWDNRINPETRNLQVRGSLPNPDRSLLPGNFVTVELLLERRAEALQIPTNAVVRDLEGAFVFVVEDNTARRRPVELGQRRSAVVEVTAGLEPGETIVSYGTQALRDGAAVRVVDF